MKLSLGAKIVSDNEGAVRMVHKSDGCKKVGITNWKMGKKIVTKQGTAKVYKGDMCRHQKEEILPRRLHCDDDTHDIK